MNVDELFTFCVIHCLILNEYVYLQVHELDWVNCAWPWFYKELQTQSTNVLDSMMYPKVQKLVCCFLKGRSDQALIFFL